MELNTLQLSITSNVYLGNFVFNKPIKDFDFFKVEGVWSDHERYKLLGKVVTFLQRKEKRPFATYTPSDENYIVGYLPSKPTINDFEVEGLKVRYEGKKPLPPTGPARRTLTELLNKSKATELRSILWSPGRHTFYPKKGKNLNKYYKNCGLIMFRGPFFRYNVLSDGRIILALDSSTHYISSEPFLREIRQRGDDLAWFKKEIEETRKQMKNLRRQFKGIHFYYSLTGSEVTIDGVDPHPISEIPLPEPIIINGKECKTVAEYLKAKYYKQPAIKHLDENQPGLKGGNFTYAPQFLYRTIPNKSIPNHILNAETFLMDTKSHKHSRDVHRPAKVRWDLISKYYNQYNFKYVDLGPLQFKMEGPIDFPITNRFGKPRLFTIDEPFPVEDLEFKLTKGLHKPPKIKNIYLYSRLDIEVSKIFYDNLITYAKERYALNLPEEAIPLETDLTKMRNQLEKSLKIHNNPEELFCIAIIPENSTLHDEITNICGTSRIPSKCVTISTAESVALEDKKMYLRDTVASLITRAGGIPWILYDKLNYDCYVAVDVGRSKSEWWAMSVVYDRNGKFEIKQGGPLVGENLDEQSIKYCVEEAYNYVQSKSLVYLRDGEVFETERKVIKQCIKDLPYEEVAIVSIKETTPYRIFRKLGQRITKPLSGDYYFLDEYNVVLCAAGVDEYEHGMPKPIVAEVIPVRGDIDVKSVVEDVFKLTYLNWSSPIHSYSKPAPLKLAHELASELSSGIRRFGPPF